MSEQQTVPVPETVSETTSAAASEAVPAAVPGPVPETPSAAAPEPAGRQSGTGPGTARRVLGAVARWTAAVLVCGGVGAGTAAGITAMERTDVPGLATESDGRWEYPRLSLPPLPEGSPRPFTSGNEGEIHHADIRRLLLPAPAGATVDPKADGGWTTTEAFLSLYGTDDRAGLQQALADSTLRHIATRSWTMPDGTRSSVHLLRFGSVAYAEEFKDALVASDDGDVVPEVLPAAVQGAKMDTFGDDIDVPGTRPYVYQEPKPYGPEQTRWAYVQAGDTLAVVLQSRKGGAAAVPFQQTVTLQNQLLG
ncbi:hypothetical protein ABZV60_02640 [Streptomyces sp. NPDC004787]|uniref:hypothetical protein n=1 Tax=Streptomyces sp. NPDC004787 TaxID=3154291 RepID=UPI0033A942AA